MHIIQPMGWWSSGESNPGFRLGRTKPGETFLPHALSVSGSQDIDTHMVENDKTDQGEHGSANPTQSEIPNRCKDQADGPTASAAAADDEGERHKDDE